MDRRNRSTALRLFAVYLVMYGTFMALNVLAPAAMARPFLMGMNLAIVYGLFLIAAAFIMALAYVILANRPVVKPS